MRMVALIGSMLVSSFAFGSMPFDFSHHVLKGGGHWKMEGGTNGKYKETATIEKLENSGEKHSIKVTWNLSIKDGDQGYEETFSLVFTESSDGFFNVYEDTTQPLTGASPVGSGYCFRKTCHYTVITDEVVAEETYHFDHGMIFNIGSKKGTYEGTPYNVAWRGALRAQGHDDDSVRGPNN